MYKIKKKLAIVKDIIVLYKDLTDLAKKQLKREFI